MKEDKASIARSKNKIIVIGAGAGGLMAAGAAAKAGADVVVLEKMKQAGRKLRISGKGRCNITNIADSHDFINHFGKQGRFLHQAFARFFSPELIKFFEDHGLKLVTERGGRVFPAQGKAVDVLNVFLNWLKKHKVSIKTSSPVTRLLVAGDSIVGVICNGREIHCDTVILATGGASYPGTGSTGDGFGLAKQVGHTVIPIRPALVPLITDTKNTGDLNGLSLRNVNVRLLVNGKRKKQLFGEMAFTNFGVTGPTILTLSGFCVDCLRASKKLSLSIDLKPALDDQKLDHRLQRDLQKRYDEEISSIMRGLLPKPLIPVCLHETDIAAKRLGGEISAQERRRLRLWLKDFRLDITGHKSLKEAIVTAGGVNTKEVNPVTMESLLIKGLYFVGEILDIHGDTGGYNLQAAFSTGRLAGLSAAQALSTKEE